MSKEALKLALEALEGSVTPDFLVGQKEKKDKAITAIKEALSSPNGEAQPDHIPDAKKMVAQPEQEPVGTIDWGGSVTWNKEIPAFGTDLYTTPPQHKPLTDEQIDELWESTASYYNTHDFARAIEAAHGIKE